MARRDGDRLNIRLDESLKRVMELAAQSRGVSISRFARQVLAEAALMRLSQTAEIVAAEAP